MKLTFVKSPISYQLYDCFKLSNIFPEMSLFDFLKQWKLGDSMTMDHTFGLEISMILIVYVYVLQEMNEVMNV